MRLLLDIIARQITEPQQVLMPAPVYLVQRASSGSGIFSKEHSAPSYPQ